LIANIDLILFLSIYSADKRNLYGGEVSEVQEKESNRYLLSKVDEN